MCVFSCHKLCLKYLTLADYKRGGTDNFSYLFPRIEGGGLCYKKIKHEFLVKLSAVPRSPCLTDASKSGKYSSHFVLNIVLK